MWIQLIDGSPFDFKALPDRFPLDADQLGIVLSRLCRFNGHTTRFYSVAEHSMLVSRIAAKAAGGLAGLWGLLHDAHESVVGDMVMPLKVYMGDAIAPYSRLASRVDHMVADRFIGIPITPEIRRVVAWADRVALATEKRDLMGSSSLTWDALPTPDQSHLPDVVPCDTAYRFSHSMYLLGALE